MTQDRRVTMTGIIPWKDQWKNKVKEVNNSLAQMCENVNISFIDRSRSINLQKISKTVNYI